MPAQAWNNIALAAERAADQQIEEEARQEAAREHRAHEIYQETWDGDGDMEVVLTEHMSEHLADVIRRAALRDDELRRALDPVVGDYANEMAQGEC